MNFCYTLECKKKAVPGENFCGDCEKEREYKKENIIFDPPV